MPSRGTSLSTIKGCLLFLQGCVDCDFSFLLCEQQGGREINKGKMATSGCITSSNNAPNMNLSALLDDSRENSPKEKCPVCRSLRKTFNCKTCVRNGEFVHSSFRNPDRFLDKQVGLRKSTDKKQLAQSKCEKILVARRQRDSLKVEIEACQSRVRLLKVLLKATSDRISEHESKREEIAKECRTRSQRCPRHEQRIGSTKALLNSGRENVEEKKAQVDAVHKKLKSKIRANIRHIMQYIFPINTVMPHQSESSSVEGVEARVRAGLADASRMVIRGRWLSDSVEELQHCIVGPTLPGSGDYSAYSADNDWTEVENQCAPNTERSLNRCGASINAAITYTIQLTDLLSFYLDVPLPCKLNYSDFCGAVLNEQQFSRRVARLNWNVLQLCFSQHVNVELLHPSHTLQNILHLINPEVSDIGRRGPINVDPQLASALEDQLQRDLAQINDGSDSDAESDVLPTEWEAVPHSVDIPAITCAHMSQQMMSTQPTSSVAGGLYTSIASVFRGWTGKR